LKGEGEEFAVPLTFRLGRSIESSPVFPTPRERETPNFPELEGWLVLADVAGLWRGREKFFRGKD
jgi:hypothetical protein